MRIGKCWRWILVCAGLTAFVVAQVGESSAMRQVQEGVRLASQGSGSQAMAIAEQVLGKNPKFVPALKLKGMLLEESGRPAEAGPVYEQALELAPNDPDLLLKTGVFKLATGKQEEAVRLLQKCTRIIPNDGDANFYLAQAYHLAEKDELALGAIRKALKAEPENAPVWQKYGELLCGTGDCEGGLKWLVKARNADASLPRIDFDIAATQYKLMDLAGASEAAARAVAARPNDVAALQLLATVDVKLARWEEAESAFERVRALKGDDVETLLGIGQCQLELKKYEAAIATIEAALKADPTRLLGHFYLSKAYAGLGKNDEAQHEAALHQLMMEHVTFVRSVESEQREAPIKAQTEKLLAAHRENEALQLYQRHFKGTSQTLGDSYVFVGKTYLFMGKTEDGLRCLRQALKIEPSARGAHTYEGILALKENDLERAEREFQAELANDPSSQLAIAEMGEVRYHQQKWADAADYLAKSRTMTPELLYMLCDSYFRLGKVDDANLNAEAAAAYARNKPGVMRGLIELLNRNGQGELAKRLGS